MVQESPTEPDPSDANDERVTGSESPDADSGEGGEGSGTGDDESSVEEAVDEAVSEAEDRRDEARETVEETGEAAGETAAEKASETSEQASEKASQASEKASQVTEQVSKKTDELSEKTEELTEKTEVVVETAADEEAALRRVKTVGKLLDDAVPIPGTNFRVGLDPILGIVPGGGDAVAAALALYPVAEAYRLDAPPGTIAKMLSLIAVDFVLGSVPVIGTLFDAFWKANEWNARALERHVQGV